MKKNLVLQVKLEGLQCRYLLILLKDQEETLEKILLIFTDSYWVGERSRM